MHFIRRSALALATVVLLALGGASPALASTPLHQQTPITADAYNDCGDTVVADGQTLWHFVLTQTEATQSSITVTFGYPPVTNQYLSTKKTGSTLHFDVTTASGVTLLDAYTAADGDLLNLSHTCIGGQPSATPSPTPPAPSSTPSPEPSATPVPSETPAPTATPVESATPSPTPTPTSQPSPTPTVTTSPSPSTTIPPAPTPSVTLPPTDATATPSDGNSGINGLLAAIGAVAVFMAAVSMFGSRKANPDDRRRYL